MINTTSLQCPSHIQIETINGACSARCIMCTINQWKRTPNIMSMDVFYKILLQCKQIYNQKFLTLHGLGEPLLDPHIVDRITLAKKIGYKGIGFATNCTHLTDNISEQLLSAGLDTIICSVDGVRKETHEHIRVGTNFDSITAQILRFIDIRNAKQLATKIFVRFIRQEANYTEWDEYKKLWENRLDKNSGDCVLRFDVHNWGEKRKIQLQERERERACSKYA